MSKIALLLVWTGKKKLYRHFSVELIAGRLRNVILTCSCSRSRFPLDTGWAPSESGANPHLFQRASLPDVPLFLSLSIPSHFPLTTSEADPFAALVETRGWNRSWPQTPYQTFNWRIHVYGILWWSPPQQLWDGFFVRPTRVRHPCSQSEGCVAAEPTPQSWSVIPRRARLAISAASPQPVLAEGPVSRGLTSGCVWDPAAVAEEEDRFTNAVKVLVLPHAESNSQSRLERTLCK